MATGNLTPTGHTIAIALIQVPTMFRRAPTSIYSKRKKFQYESQISVNDINSITKFTYTVFDPIFFEKPTSDETSEDKHECSCVS